MVRICYVGIYSEGCLVINHILEKQIFRMIGKTVVGVLETAGYLYEFLGLS